MENEEGHRDLDKASSSIKRKQATLELAKSKERSIQPGKARTKYPFPVGALPNDKESSLIAQSAATFDVHKCLVAKEVVSLKEPFKQQFTNHEKHMEALSSFELLVEFISWKIRTNTQNR